MNAIQPSLFMALGEPTRLGIVEMLAHAGELSAGDISSRFSTSASAISQHLKVLRDAGLVIMQKRAQRRVYRLNTAAMVQLEQWSKLRTEEWNTRLNAMDDYITSLNRGAPSIRNSRRN